MINWTLQLIPIKKLKPNPCNPRQISKDQAAQLEGVIHRYGMIEKIVVDSDLSVISGHQRLKILKKMKVKEVECWVPDQQLTQEEIDHLTIALNLNQGKWDYDVLANEWDVLDLLKWGFTEQQLLGDCEKAESEVEKEDDKIKKEKAKKQNCCPSCGFEF